MEQIMAIKQNEGLFDNVDIDSIAARAFRVLNALAVSIHRCLQKYEVIYQIIDQGKTDMNRSVVLLTWELVDWLERTRKIIGNGAGLKKKDPVLQLLTRSLDNAKDLRNVLQHFDQFLTRSMKSDFAPLGAVSAIHKLDDETVEFFVYNAGIVKGETHMGQVEMPEEFFDNVDYVTLQIDGLNLNVSEIVRKLLLFYSRFRDQLAEKYPKK